MLFFTYSHSEIALKACRNIQRFKFDIRPLCFHIINMSQDTSVSLSVALRRVLPADYDVSRFKYFVCIIICLGAVHKRHPQFGGGRGQSCLESYQPTGVRGTYVKILEKTADVFYGWSYTSIVVYWPHLCLSLHAKEVTDLLHIRHLLSSKMNNSIKQSNEVAYISLT